MITAICLNPSFDKTLEVDTIQLGQINRIRDVRVDLGGTGINVAIVAKRLGLDVDCVGMMGEEGSADLCAMMDKEGLCHHFLSVPGRIRTNLKIFNRVGKEVTEFNEAGPQVTQEQLDQMMTLARERAAGSDMVVMTGSLPPGCPEGTYRDLMKAMEGKKCILDTVGKELELCAKEAHPFLVKPNLKELETTRALNCAPCGPFGTRRCFSSGWGWSTQW